MVMATLAADRPSLPTVRTGAGCAAPARPTGFTPADISSLSDDLLRSVFAHVTLLDRAVTLRHVCKRWREALEGPPAETPPGAARVRGAPPPDSAFGRLVLRSEPRLSGRVDCTLLARLLWLSDVGAPPLANAALLARAAADGGGTAAPQQIPTPIPPPGWDAPRPHLRSLDLSACAWRPSACFRAPPLRRVIGLAPNLTECRAAGMVLAGVRKGGGEDAPAPAPVTLDAREAALLRAAAAAHPSLRVLTVDVAFPLPPTPTDLVAQAGQEQAAAAGAAPPRPPPPPGAAADLADAVAAAGGPGPLSLGRLSISSRPSAWWFPERPALAAAAAAVGAAAGGGGGPETLELVGLSGEEAAALACAALAPASTRVRALIITGCADGAAAWSPALAAAVGGCGSLARVTVDCRAWDEGDAAGLAGAVGVAAAAGRTLVATLNGVLIGPGALPPRAPTTPDRSPMQIG